MARARIVTFIGALTFYVTSSYSAFAQIPPIVEVSKTLPVVTYEELSKEKTSLLDSKETLTAKAQRHNEKCSNVQEGTSLAAECGKEQDELEKERQEYVEAVTRFNRKVGEIGRLEIASQEGRPTPLDLAKDPELAKSSRLRLELINSQLERLRKAIYILGDSNPEWHKEWEELHEDQVKATHQLMWKSLDLVTLGIAEAFKVPTEGQLEKAQEAFKGQDFSSLILWRDTLVKGREHLGFSIPAWDKEIDSLNRLEAAVNKHNTVEAIAKLRDAVFSGKEAYEEIRKAGLSKDAMNQLHHGSLALGGVAVSLVGGVGGKVAAPVSTVLTAIEAGLTAKLVREESRQFDALSEQAFERHQKKLELMQKQAELETQASNLAMVLQRSEGLRTK